MEKKKDSKDGWSYFSPSHKRASQHVNQENPEYQMLKQDPSPLLRGESPVPSPTVLILSNDVAGQRMTASEEKVLRYITLGK